MDKIAQYTEKRFDADANGCWPPEGTGDLLPGEFRVLCCGDVRLSLPVRLRDALPDVHADGEAQAVTGSAPVGLLAGTDALAVCAAHGRVQESLPHH
jgi:hypothetical protein